jgi:hypothetical protein
VSKYIVALVPVVYLLLACPTPAAAYLDPVTGSIAFQVVMATAITGLAAVKIYWRRLKSLLSKDEPQSDAHKH